MRGSVSLVRFRQMRPGHLIYAQEPMEVHGKIEVVVHQLHPYVLGMCGEGFFSGGDGDGRRFLKNLLAAGDGDGDQV